MVGIPAHKTYKWFWEWFLLASSRGRPSTLSSFCLKSARTRSGYSARAEKEETIQPWEVSCDWPRDGEWRIAVPCKYTSNVGKPQLGSRIPRLRSIWIRSYTIISYKLPVVSGRGGSFKRAVTIWGPWLMGSDVVLESEYFRWSNYIQKHQRCAPVFSPNTNFRTSSVWALQFVIMSNQHIYIYSYIYIYMHMYK